MTGKNIYTLSEIVDLYLKDRPTVRGKRYYYQYPTDGKVYIKQLSAPEWKFKIYRIIRIFFGIKPSKLFFDKFILK